MGFYLNKILSTNLFLVYSTYKSSKMFLTGINFINQMYRTIPKKRDRWWKIMRLKEQARHFKRRVFRNRIGMSMNMVRRAHVFQTKSRLLRPWAMNKIRTQRLSAACEEYGVKTAWMQQGLANSGVKLNKQMLIIMSIYEPRTFEQLIELSQRAQIEQL